MRVVARKRFLLLQRNPTLVGCEESLRWTDIVELVSFPARRRQAPRRRLKIGRGRAARLR